MRDFFRRHSFSITFVVVLAAIVFYDPSNQEAIARFSGFTMGTSYDIQVVDIPASASLDELSSGVATILSRLDREIFSTYAENSEVSQFNRHRLNAPFSVSDDLMAVLSQSKEVAIESGGVFDITIGPLVNLWGFGPGELVQRSQIPSDAEIRMALESIGVENLLLDTANSEISKTKPITIDLSGIAKGYAVDQAAAYLESNGITNYFIEVGGEIKVSGLKPGDLDWVPAIEAPEDGPVRVYEVLTNRGETLALAGSGDYRNYFELDGVRYSHEIDPRSGKPVSHNLAAAFVLAESAARADALATALMILGVEEGRQLIERENLKAFLIYRNESAELNHFVSQDFDAYINR